VTVDRVDELSASELGPAVGVDHTASHITTFDSAASDGVVQRAATASDDFIRESME
jgi:hypothetical protein